MNRLRCFLLSCLFVSLMMCNQKSSRAHPDHASLPSTGVRVRKNQLLISPAAVKAIDMKTEKIKLGGLKHMLSVNAHVELTWAGQAKVSTLTAGKIVRVLVKPGDRVKAGQELARVESLELESLQADLLQTHAQIDRLVKLIKQREPLVKSGGIAEKVLLASQTELQQRQAQYEITFHKLQALGVANQTIQTIITSGKSISSIAVTSPIARVD